MVSSTDDDQCQGERCVYDRHDRYTHCEWCLRELSAEGWPLGMFLIDSKLRRIKL